MKGSNSRQVAAKDNRFSNLFHIQGGMVTDSDLGEAASLAQSRDEAIAGATIQSGIPAHGGLLSGTGLVQAGSIFADGKHGQFRLTAEAEDKAETLAAQLAGQMDFPAAPPLPAGKHLLYADLWERTIFAAQDARLTDAGLHGTQTSYRTQTMVQLKTIPWEGEWSDQGGYEHLRSHPALARTGNAVLRIGQLAADSDTGGCDPCADQITISRVMPNALWRLEVVAVRRDKEGLVTGFDLAWSMENGSAVEANTTAGRHALKRTEGEAVVYEFFSDTSEAHKGWFPGGDDAAPVTISNFAPTIDGAVIEAEGGDPYIRRWDGHARITGSDVDPTGTSNASRSGGAIVINTGSFTARLTFEERDMLVGDHWLVELRRFAEPADQLFLVGAQTNEGDTFALPRGIEHFHCPVGLIDGQKLMKPDQALAQITGFPALTNLAASDVAYDAPDGCIVFEPFDAETDGQREVHNVKQALDSLCDLDASRIAFHPDGDCETLSETTNVAEALEALCAADDDATLRLMLRTMMDWGVVCGHRVEMEPGKDTVLTLTPGTALNPQGLLQAHSEISFEIKEAEILGSIDRQIELGLDVCLSMELRADASPRFTLSHEAFVRRSSDRNLIQRLKDCLTDKTQLDSSDILQSVDEKQAVALSKVLTAATSREGLGTTLMLDAEEDKALEEIFEILAEELLADASDTSRIQFETLREDAERLFEEAKNKARDEIAFGVARMMRMIALFTAMAVVERDMQSVCTCERGLLDCPEHSLSDRGLIPLAAIKVTKAGEGLAVREVSNYTYRKQSHNWRSNRYYFGDTLTPVLDELGEKCGGDAGIDTIAEALLSWNPTDEELKAAEKSPYWPPDPGISNLEEINGVDLRGYGEDKARDILKEASIELLDEAVFYLEEGDVYLRIAELLNKAPTQPLNLNFEARSGDTVGMTVDREGRVTDVFVVRAAPFGGYLKQKVLPEAVVTDNVRTILPGLMAEYLQSGEGEDTSGGTAELGGLIGDVEGLRGDIQVRGTEIDDLRIDIEELRNSAPDLSMIPGLQAQVDALINNPAVVPDVGPLEDALAALDTRVQVLQDGGTPEFDPSGLQGQITTLTTEIDTVRGLIPAEVNLTGLQTDISGLRADVTTLQNTTPAAFDPSGLQGQIGTLSAEIDTVRDLIPAEVNLSGLQADISNLQEDITTLQNASPNEFDPTSLQASISALGGRITTLENAPDPDGFDPSGLQASIAALGGRITTLENEPDPATFNPSGLQSQINALDSAVETLQGQSGGSVDLNPLQNRVQDLERENTQLRTQVQRNTPIVLALSPETLPAFKNQTDLIVMGQLQAMKENDLQERFGSNAGKIKDEVQAFFNAK